MLSAAAAATESPAPRALSLACLEGPRASPRTVSRFLGPEAKRSNTAFDRLARKPDGQTRERSNTATVFDRLACERLAGRPRYLLTCTRLTAGSAFGPNRCCPRPSPAWWVRFDFGVGCVTRVGRVAGGRRVDADPRPATRDPGRNQRPATRDPERPSGPARTCPVRPGHTRPDPDIFQNRDFIFLLQYK